MIRDACHFCVRRTTTALLWVVISFGVIAVHPASAMDDAAGDGGASAHVMRTMAANALVASACPDGLRLSDLDVARRLNERAALNLALDNAERNRREQEKLDPLDPSSYHFADDPAEASRVVQKHYGPDSFLTRSAVAVLSIADVAERSSQAPLDRINNVTDAMVQASREALGWRSLPTVELRSRVRYDEAGVRMLSRW